MLHDDYCVRLEAFQGPMDLLLYLIRKNEVDIHDIPVAKITEQYLAFVRRALGTGDEQGAGAMLHLDVETAGEFLVLASTLMEIKSRMILPARAPEGEGDDGASVARPEAAADPRAQLVQQLLEYKRFRDAAMLLEQREKDWAKRFPAAAAYAQSAPAPAVDEDAPGELEDLTIVDLMSAFARIIETVDFARVGEHRILDDETPIQLHAEDLLDRLRRDGGEGKRLTFSEVFRGRTRSEAIGLFLAMLELMRYGKVKARQQEHAAGAGEGGSEVGGRSGAIIIELVTDDSASLAAEASVV